MQCEATLPLCSDLSKVEATNEHDLVWCAVELVPDLIRAGVSCFKIEGRLKGPEYVALTTKVYREAVDRAWESLQGGTASAKQPPLLTKEVALDLAQVASSYAHTACHTC